MERKPIVSVIMGIYNGAERMDEAIASVCSQTLQDWELIICDDGSTDNTWEKLQEWSRKEPRIRIIRNEKNLHLGESLNRCLTISRGGGYIARMDDDDISYENRLKEQVEFLESHPEYGWVGSLVDCYDGERVVRNRFFRKAEPEKADFLRGTQFVHPTTMIRRECLDAVGGYRVSRETRRAEDYDLFMRLYARGYRGYNIQTPLLRYYVNKDSMREKRLYRYRLDECRVRYHGFKKLGLMPKAWPYVIRPLVVGLIPHRIMWKLFYQLPGEKDKR